jgi:heat-inducible transcriptional repressor
MVDQNTLSEREQLILHAVVHTFITTAEAVGSRTIVKRFNLDFSPATVRNVMADLEEAGYLQQRHTSSGRVPTDLGYRYYVDYLMRVQDLTQAERSRIELELTDKLNDADEVMRQTSQLLALISHQTGIVVAPNESRAQVRYIDLMPIAEGRVALLVADNYGRIRTVVLDLDDPMDLDEMRRLSGFLNDALRGAALDNLAATVQAKMQDYLDERRTLAERAVSVLSLYPAERPGQLFLEGATQLFEQPEFSDIAHARQVFSLLEESDRVADLLAASMAHSQRTGTAVVIGSESKHADLEDISVVAAPYHVAGREVGVLGVLGPRRMPYSKLTAVVGYTADMVGRLLTRLSR